MDRALIAFENAHFLDTELFNIHSPAPPLRCTVLDSSHPSTIRRIETQLELDKTLFLLVNKSGYRVGVHSLFLYFQRAIDGRSSVASSRQFVAGTEPNSFLATIANQYRFRFIPELPPVTPAPYCSLVDLTVLLVALAAVEPEVIRAASREMKRTYLEPSPGENNPV